MEHKMLPHEILLNILDHLEGDRKTILSLALTCKIFRDLLMENEPRVTSGIALNHKPGPIKFLLEATAPTTMKPTFRWLFNAYDRGQAIELLVNALENAGIYTDQSVFGSTFSVFGRPLVPEDHIDVRRYLLTMLLALELCSVSGHEANMLGWASLGPRWTAGFVLNCHELIRFVVKMLFVVIEMHDFCTWGPSDALSGFFPSSQHASQLTNYLLSGLILSGARGIVDILSTTYEDYNQFVAVARLRLYGAHLEGHMQNEIWPQQQIPRSLWLLGALRYRHRIERFGGDPTYKEYVGEIDIDGWKSDISDDEKWIHFVHSNGWSKPLHFRPTQLQMACAKPVFRPQFKANGMNLWNANDEKRIMAEPLAA